MKEKSVEKQNLDILFWLDHNIHKSSCGLCYWTPDSLIDRSYQNPSMKRSGAKKQRPHELLWMLSLGKKTISNSKYLCIWSFCSQRNQSNQTIYDRSIHYVWGWKRYFSMMMFRIPLLQTMEKEQFALSSAS